MSQFFSAASGLFLPVLLAVILCHGFLKRAPVYDLFVEGCREGLKSAAEITPYIIAVFLVIQIMTDSGALESAGKVVQSYPRASGDTEGAGLFSDYETCLRKRYAGDHRKYR